MSLLLARNDKVSLYIITSSVYVFTMAMLAMVFCILWNSCIGNSSLFAGSPPFFRDVSFT